MRNVEHIMTAWQSGTYVGPYKPSTRVTVEKSYFLRVTEPVLGQWTRGPARWYQRLYANPEEPSARNTPQIETEIPNVLSVQHNTSIEADVGNGTITIMNTRLQGLGEPPELAGQLGQPGYYTASRGESAEARGRWNHAPNEWQGVFSTNALIRVYQGFGGEEKPIPQAVEDGNLVLNGVFLVDTVVTNSAGNLVLNCRTVGKLLIEQPLFPPLVPKALYPLHYTRYVYEDYKIPSEPPPSTDHQVVNQPATYVTSSTDATYGGFDTGATGHNPSLALDWPPDPPSSPGSYTLHQTYWLSEPKGSAGDHVWTEFDVFSAPVNIAYLLPWAGNYHVMVSIMENGDWVWPEESGQGGIGPDGVPYVMSFGSNWEGGQPPGVETNQYILPRTYYAQRMRLTFSNLTAAQEGGYRAGARMIIPQFDRTIVEYPRYVLASTAYPYNTENKTGYWQVRSNGKVYAFGDAREQPLNVSTPWSQHDWPVVGMDSTLDGEGYYTVDTSGRVLAYGTAQHFGDLAAGGTFDIMDIAAGPFGGYWLLQRDGTVTAFGETHYGNANPAGTMPSGAPVWAKSIDGHPTTSGYRVLSTDGTVEGFNLTTYGDAGRFLFTDTEYVTSIRHSFDGEGYWVTSGGGWVQAFGSAQHFGDATRYPPEQWAPGLTWDLIPYSNGGGGYAVQHANGRLDFQGGFEWFGDLGHGEGQLRKDGNYKDYSDIVKELLLWAGYYLYQFPAPNAMPDVYGNIETTGAFAKDPLPDELFDKKSVMEAITSLKEVVGYVTWIDAEGGFRFESPNWWSPGNFDFQGVHLDVIPEIDERVNATEYQSSHGDSDARSEIIISSAEPTADYKGTIITRLTPPSAKDLRGMIKPAIWSNGVFTDYKQQKVMADLIAMHSWFARRQGQLSCVANPLIGINDQVRIFERVTGETYVHYVRGVSFNHDLRTGEFTMTLTTNWLGGTPLSELPLFFTAATKSDGLGYWQAGSDGNIYSFGSAQLYSPNEPETHTEWLVAMRSSVSGNGYYTMDRSGKIISYGDAVHAGQVTSSALDVIDLAVTPSGEGYWVLQLDGTVTAFGDAVHHGNGTPGPTGPVDGRLNWAYSIESHPSANGYWIMMTDGVVEAHNLTDYGSADDSILVGTEYFTSLRRDQAGTGYYIISGGGQVTALGSATDLGDVTRYPPEQWVLGLAWDILPALYPGDSGYAVQHADGTLEMVGDYPFEGAVGSSSGYVPSSRQQTWAIATEAAAERSLIRDNIVTVSDDVIAAMGRSSSSAAQTGISTNFGAPEEPTIKARVP